MSGPKRKAEDIFAETRQAAEKAGLLEAIIKDRDVTRAGGCGSVVGEVQGKSIADALDLAQALEDGRAGRARLLEAVVRHLSGAGSPILDGKYKKVPASMMRGARAYRAA